MVINGVARVWMLECAGSALESVMRTCAFCTSFAMPPHGLRCGMRIWACTLSSFFCTVLTSALNAGVARRSAASGDRAICAFGELSTAPAGEGSAAGIDVINIASVTADSFDMSAFVLPGTLAGWAEPV